MKNCIHSQIKYQDYQHWSCSHVFLFAMGQYSPYLSDVSPAAVSTWDSLSNFLLEIRGYRLLWVDQDVVEGLEGLGACLHFERG